MGTSQSKPIARHGAGLACMALGMGFGGAPIALPAGSCMHPLHRRPRRNPPPITRRWSIPSAAAYTSITMGGASTAAWNGVCSNGAASATVRRAGRAGRTGGWEAACCLCDGCPPFPSSVAPGPRTSTHAHSLPALQYYALDSSTPPRNLLASGSNGTAAATTLCKVRQRGCCAQAAHVMAALQRVATSSRLHRLHRRSPEIQSTAASATGARVLNRCRHPAQLSGCALPRRARHQSSRSACSA